MTPGIAAMLLGAFVVPVVLLVLGHRFRRRSPRARRAFWGAVIGHVLAVPIASAAAIYPAAEWDAGDRLRGALGLWSLLVLPLAGAVVGVLLAAGQRLGAMNGRQRPDGADPSGRDVVD